MAVSDWQEGRVRVVVIDRPERANAIDLETGLALSAMFDALEADDDTWAVVLTGAGERVFSAGMDLGAVAAGQAGAINGAPGGFAGIVRREFSKPVVAAVNGAALGGGFEIVLACDLVVAGRSARFGLPEVTRGLIAASGGLVRLPERLPWALAMQHILLGEPLTADEALAHGLVNQVVDDPDVVPAAVALAERICANGPLAVRASKSIARTAVAQGQAAAWQINDELAPTITTSQDAAEGMIAAREKRPAAWSGR
jgi:enoyl-CoA hydratase/carnithine racemase